MEGAVKRALIISSAEEHYYFEEYLRAAQKHGGLDIVVLDTSRFPTESNLSVTMDARGCVDGMLEVSRYDAAGVVTFESVSIRSIAVAWYLRAGRPKPDLSGSDKDNQFSADESAHMLHSLQTVAPWRWINTRAAVRAAENNKLYQQKIAAESGLLVPETLASNDPSTVQRFAAVDGRLLLKSYGFTTALDPTEFCYSNIYLEEYLLAHSPAIAACPVYSQRYVEKKYEYRVMVIGHEVLACRIDSQASERARIDWRRYDFDNVRHEAVRLPCKVNAALLRFMQKMDLRYGAIDMIERPDGEFVFLEVNPSGQWGWIHLLTQIPIPQAVARMLAAA